MRSLTSPMIGQHRLLLLWVSVLLGGALFPTGHCGSSSWKRHQVGSMAGGPKPPLSSWGRGASRQGLKMAGAAAAGALGGAALGYGVGSLGRLRPGYGYVYDGDGYNRWYPGEQVVHNQWVYYTGASSSRSAVSLQVVLGSTLPFMLGNWIGLV
ncbi:shadow of prion protein-like isoform X2 [Arapaima gigas]